MALRDIFKFRELPESETSKPFLEHLEDLRWTIVKMAITLVLAMIICFAFRSTLVRVLQVPLTRMVTSSRSNLIKNSQSAYWVLIRPWQDTPAERQGRGGNEEADRCSPLKAKSPVGSRWPVLAEQHRK